jgi:hypothetical protein
MNSRCSTCNVPFRRRQSNNRDDTLLPAIQENLVCEGQTFSGVRGEFCGIHSGSCCTCALKKGWCHLSFDDCACIMCFRKDHNRTLKILEFKKFFKFYFKGGSRDIFDMIASHVLQKERFPELYKEIIFKLFDESDPEPSP